MSGKPLRRYAAAKSDRLTADFMGNSNSANQIIASSLSLLRSRSRQLCMDNDYAKRFLGMVSANVVGSNGIALQSSLSTRDGKPISKIRDVVEHHWRVWGKRDNCTMSGRSTWRDVQNQIIRALARDGEVLVRKVKGGNLPYGMALHVIEADYLAHTYNLNDSKRIITMGVEHNGYGKPIAYHLYNKHPGDRNGHLLNENLERVPAEDLLHLYVEDRPGQMRGVPWFHTAIRRLNMLGKYEEAEQVAAREAASKMGFFYSPDGTGLTGEQDEKGNLITESEPGMFEQLPDGVHFSAYDPQHPVSAFSDFVKAVLRGAASGLGVSYNTLANDLEGVNFSSIRSGVLEEREQWRSLQAWFIDQFCQPVFDAWLETAVLTNDDMQNAFERYGDRLSQVRWQPRGWAWVDPLKDQQANKGAIDLGVLTRSDIAAQQGKDLEEIFEQLAREQALAKQFGLALESGKSGEVNE